MSAAAHTPGLLVHDTTGYPRSDVRSVTGRNVANTWGTGHPRSRAAHTARVHEDRANARRIVACWNACDGISTETLELVPRFTEAGIKTVRAVEAQRDALLGIVESVAAEVLHPALPGNAGPDDACACGRCSLIREARVVAANVAGSTS